MQGPRRARIGVNYAVFSMNRDRPGKPPKLPLKAPKGDKQLGVADFFKPDSRTASEKRAAEGEAAKAQAKRDAAAAAMKRQA